MVTVGIERMNVFGGTVSLNVKKLATHRNLDTTRFENLLMVEKSVALPFEDAVTCGFNAAQAVVADLSPAEKDRIELLIACSESGIDFSKSISSYLHRFLNLNRNCRMFEIKQACFSGVAGLQMAINFILSQASPGAKALVVATDIARFLPVDEEMKMKEDWRFSEPSSGAGAVAMLVSEQPHVFQIDVGANGCYGYEVADTCRPFPDGDAGDVDLSLLSYLDCCENSYKEYAKRVADVDYRKTFQYLAFHAPFGGMVKGAHRTMMRKMAQAKPNEIEADFNSRVSPGLNYCQRVGNIMGATASLSLASTIDNASFDQPARIGVFSYGSGCCSEFFSGVAGPESQSMLRRFKIKEGLDQRHELSIDQYEAIIQESDRIRFGTHNVESNLDLIPGLFRNKARPQLVLKKIENFIRHYELMG